MMVLPCVGMSSSLTLGDVISVYLEPSSAGCDDDVPSLSMDSVSVFGYFDSNFADASS